jgi:protein-S-isoprenylcysteine O-methyltransferase Ste14
VCHAKAIAHKNTYALRLTVVWQILSQRKVYRLSRKKTQTLTAMYKYLLLLDLIIGIALWKFSDKIKNQVLRTFIILLAGWCVLAGGLNLILWICLK